MDRPFLGFNSLCKWKLVCLWGAMSISTMLSGRVAAAACCNGSLESQVTESSDARVCSLSTPSTTNSK
eukprot:5306004-Amphidinium_carterae.1